MSASSEHRIYFLLQNVSHRLKKKADQLALDSGGMTTAQAGVLNIIIQQGSASQAQIAKILSQRESATATMAARLQSAGYINKERSEQDRRAWVLTPTRKGRAAQAKMRASLAKVNELLDNTLPKSKIDALAESLQELIAALDSPDLR